MGDPTKIFTGTGEVIFSGSAINYGTVQTATVTFQGTAVNDGAIDASDLVRFTDDSRNLDVVECPIIEILQTASNAGELRPLTRVLFGDSAENESLGLIDTSTGVAVFGGSVIINGEVKAATITVSGNATNNASMVASVKVEFLDSASNTASITGTAVFKGNASNNGGSVVGNLSLFGNATNSGSVQGDIELNDNASNSGSSSGNVITYDNITLNGVIYYYISGTITSGVTVLLNDDKTLASSLSGTDTIDGQSSNWSTNGSGVLTYSAVDGGNNFYAPTITSISADDETPAKYTSGNADGGSFTITVVADDGGDTQNISYQWQVLGDSWNNIIGATQSTYSSDTNGGNINNTTTQYRCVVTNSVGSVESSTITITPVDAYGTIISTSTNSITLELANNNTQSVNNGVTNTIADGNGGTTTVAVYPDLGDELYSFLYMTAPVGYGGLSQAITYNYLADGNGGYTEDGVYPVAGSLLGTHSSDSNYSVYITEIATTYYFTVNVNADGNGGYTLAPQYQLGSSLGNSSATISLPNGLASYSYTLSYLSDGNGGYTLGGYPTSNDKLGTAISAGVIYAPNSAGSLTFNIGYWGDGMGGYTAMNEVVAGTYVAEDSSYTYVVNSTLDGCDSIPKE